MLLSNKDFSAIMLGSLSFRTAGSAWLRASSVSGSPGCDEEAEVSGCSVFLQLKPRVGGPGFR